MKMTLLKNSEQMIFTEGSENFNYDMYNFTTRSPMATKEITVIVDFLNDEITGDTIAYGSWYDIEENDCIELLQTLEPEEVKRDFTNIIKKCKMKD